MSSLSEPVVIKLLRQPSQAALNCPILPPVDRGGFPRGLSSEAQPYILEPSIVEISTVVTWSSTPRFLGPEFRLWVRWGTGPSGGPSEAFSELLRLSHEIP